MDARLTCLPTLICFKKTTFRLPSRFGLPIG